MHNPSTYSMTCPSLFFLRVAEAITVEVNSHQENGERPTKNVLVNIQTAHLTVACEDVANLLSYFKREFEMFRFKGDDFYRIVARFHLPCVRSYYDGHDVHILPSALTAMFTNVNIDYKYFSNEKIISWKSENFSEKAIVLYNGRYKDRHNLC